MDDDQTEEALDTLTNLILPREIAQALGHPPMERRATVAERRWLGANCWNCRKPRADCTCIFP